MGSSRDVICESCGHRFQASEGGGFFFHLLHCDLCGREKSVGFDELGDAHLRYVKGLSGPWMVGTMKMDKHIQENYPVQPLAEEEYNSIIEETAGQCGCGGRFRLQAPPRCPVCRSAELREDPSGTTAMYD